MRTSNPSVHELLISGDMERVKALISKTPTTAKLKDDSGRLPIHWAASLGSDEVFQMLLDVAEDVDVTDDSGITPLIIAASAGKPNFVNLLLAKGANVNAQNNGGHSALQYAASKNHCEIVEMLLAKNANPNICDETGATPLHRAASQGHSKVVQVLLTSERIDVNMKEKLGNTALHLACEEDRIDDAKFLIQHGARLDIENKEEKTPLDLAPIATRPILTSFASSL